MRRLLLPISLAGFIFVISSCHNIKNSGQNSTTEIKAISKDSIYDAGAKKVKGQTETSGIVGKDKGIKKDSVHYSGKGNAIIHHAPNEDKIDSIKNSKNNKK
jgi:hypothetical protein